MFDLVDAAATEAALALDTSVTWPVYQPRATTTETETETRCEHAVSNTAHIYM